MERMIIMPIIGIPRGLLYYRYEILWKSFFDALGVKYVISKKSNIDILSKGKKKSIDEACLSLKLFIGHIESIKDKCSHIFIPRIYSLEKTEQVCTNFNCLYDLIKNLYPKLNIVHINIDVKHHKNEKNAYVMLAKGLGFNKKEALSAYKIAKEKEKEYLDDIYENALKKIKSNKTKILLLGHSYNLQDKMIGKEITDFLNKNDIEIIFSYEMNLMYKDEYANKISPKVHWTMNKEILASFEYFKDKVDGVIVISAFPCGPDSLTNEMIMRKKEKSKVLLLTFEDLNSNVALTTRLESFLDMLKGGIHV